MPVTLERVEAAIAHASFQVLPLLPAHATACATLPSYRDHRDPFDRMLLAQARHGGLTVMTEDAKLARYGVPVIGCA